MPQPKRFAAFVSGTGRTLRHLHARIEAGELDAKVALVVASRPCRAAEWAEQRSIPVVIHEPLLAAESIDRLLEDVGAEWGVLAGYTRLIAIPDRLQGRFVNIHPALLPEFGGEWMYGLRVHRAVLDAGATESGCTVHLCDDAYDTGPIVAQRRCEVREGDTAETLAARVFELELSLYPEALEHLFSGRYSIEGPLVRMMR